MEPVDPPGSRFRETTYTVIFGHETRSGRIFDVALIIAILTSVVVVMLDSVTSLRQSHGVLLRQLEWGFTVLFSIEYILRLWCARRAVSYATSFFGVVDLVAVLPTYLSLFIPGGQALLSIRALRLLRIFRVLKLVEYVIQASILAKALKQSRHKIVVFLLAVMTLAVIVGALMYLIEGPASGFTSIPRSVYWAIVTLTTVGYGDIAPQSNLGQILAVMLMILGYGIIAVPTGIVTVELGKVSRQRATPVVCPSCSFADHGDGARYCQQCGHKLVQQRTD